MAATREYAAPSVGSSVTHLAEVGTEAAVSAAAMSAATSLDESDDTLAIAAWKALLAATDETSAWNCEGYMTLAWAFTSNDE